MAGSRLLVTTNGKLVPCGSFSKIPHWQTRLSFNVAYAGVLAEIHNLGLRRFEFPMSIRPVLSEIPLYWLYSLKYDSH